MTKRRQRLAVAPTLPLDPAPGEDSPYALGIAAAGLGESDDVVRGLMEMAAANQDARGTYALATWLLFGVRGYSRDPRKAADLLKSAAQGGVREAMYDLGVSYELGVGIRRNRRHAFAWYLRAAVRGDPDAVRSVANCYASGFGVPTDIRSATVWYEWAESLGGDDREATEYRQWRKNS